MRAYHAHAHIHTNDLCTFAVWESGDARRLKKRAICRAMASTLCAWEYRWGCIHIHTYIYMYAHATRARARASLSLSDTFFCPRAGFFLPWRLPAYARMTRRPSPWSINPKSPSRSPLGVRHPASCGAQRFLFQIFSISMKGENSRRLKPVYEWNGAISRAEAVKQYISRYRIYIY